MPVADKSDAVNPPENKEKRKTLTLFNFRNTASGQNLKERHARYEEDSPQKASGRDSSS